MRSLIKVSKKPYDLKIVESKIPELSSGEVLVKISGTGICGSDLHIYLGDSGYDWVPYPIVMGHEMTGKVTEVHNQEDRKLIGSRVVIDPYMPCGECHACLNGKGNRCDGVEFYGKKRPPTSLQYGFRKDGGMTEYFSVKKENLCFVPSEVSEEVAAVSESLAVGLTAVKKVEEVEGKKVAVFGPGPIGFGISLIVKGLGADVVLIGTQDDHYRLNLADQLSIKTLKLSSNIVKEALEIHNGFDIVFDSAAHPSVFDTGIQILVKGGKFISVGISTLKYSVPIDQLVRGEIELIGSYGTTKNDIMETLDLAKNEEFNFNKLITSSFYLEDYSEAFESLISKKELKVILKN